jgi:MFS family permease
MILAIIIGMGCGFLWWATVAALLAEMQHFPFAKKERYSQDLQLAILIACVFPIGTILSPFLTAGFEYGFNWSFSRNYRQRRLREKPEPGGEEIVFRPFWREPRKIK